MAAVNIDGITELQFMRMAARHICTTATAAGRQPPRAAMTFLGGDSELQAARDATGAEP